MIKVIFTDNNLPASVAIRLFTWSDWSHVGLILPDDSVVDSRWSHKGVRRHSFDDFVKEGLSRFEVREFHDIPDLVNERILTQIGKPYDFTAILGLPFHRNWQEDDSWFCSELIAWGCAVENHPIVHKEQWRVTPQDIFEAR